jgi:hypothetical protein
MASGCVQCSETFYAGRWPAIQGEPVANSVYTKKNEMELFAISATQTQEFNIKFDWNNSRLALQLRLQVLRPSQELVLLLIKQVLPLLVTTVKRRQATQG